MKKMFEMIWAFFKVGICTFGGGYAMLPILQREIVDKKGWATEEELLDYYAVGQCTPGVIAVNTATFIGYKYMGVFGGVMCTLGVVLPSLIIITIIAAILQSFADLALVKNAFAGIRVAVCVLILNSVVKLWKSSVIDKTTLSIFLAVFLLSVVLKTALDISISPVIFVILAGLAGVLIKTWEAKKL